jgi:hypothetical protein
LYKKKKKKNGALSTEEPNKCLSIMENLLQQGIFLIPCCKSNLVALGFHKEEIINLSFCLTLRGKFFWREARFETTSSFLMVMSPNHKAYNYYAQEENT